MPASAGWSRIWPAASQCGLFYRREGHVPTVEAMAFLLAEIERAGVEVVLGTTWTGRASADEVVIDCRGLGAAG